MSIQISAEHASHNYESLFILLKQCIYQLFSSLALQMQLPTAKPFSEYCQTFKMERLAKIVNGF